MDIDYLEIAKIVIPAIAILLSIFTIMLTKKNLKKQLGLTKLEEVLEILFFLKGYYHRLLRLFVDTDEKIELLKQGKKLPEYLTELDRYIEGFTKVVDADTITQKILRLKVLSNAYLPNSKDHKGLKVKIHIISDLYYHMYVNVMTFGNGIKKEDAKIPKPGSMDNFINSITDGIIKEMGFGYANIKKDSQKNYFENHFHNDVELIEK